MEISSSFDIAFIFNSATAFFYFEIFYNHKMHKVFLKRIGENSMSKRKKIEKIHNKIMIASEQIGVLSDFLGDYADNGIQREVLARIINEKSRTISRTNEKLGILFRL